MEKITVVLAEDHAVVRQATAEIIHHQPDMEVVGQAGTGAEAVHLARCVRPDVVVMDIAMPHVDGLEATRQIRDDCADTRVLVLTAREEEHYVVELLRAGAVGYLSKTAGLDDLLQAIRAVARGESVLAPAAVSVVVRRLKDETKQTQEPSPLTNRELQVLSLVAEGLTNRDIGRQLSISLRTVEAHLTHIYDKLDVGSRTEAVVWGIRQGWIDPQRGDRP